MRPGFLGMALIVLAVGIAGRAGAQQPQPQGPPLIPNGIGPYFQPPGAYGTSYGVPSFGVPRLYTAFSSPYGGGYGYGYGPYVTSLNWYYLNGGSQPNRQGYTVPGYFYGGSDYNTFPAPYSMRGAESPPIGVYAPTIGPAWFVNR